MHNVEAYLGLAKVLQEAQQYQAALKTYQKA